MHAASRHGTPSLTSLPKDGGVSCFARSSGRSPIQFFDRTQPCLTSVKLMELAGPLGHSPRLVTHFDVSILARKRSTRFDLFAL